MTLRNILSVCLISIIFMSAGPAPAQSASSSSKVVAAAGTAPSGERVGSGNDSEGSDDSPGDIEKAIGVYCIIPYKQAMRKDTVVKHSSLDLPDYMPGKMIIPADFDGDERTVHLWPYKDRTDDFQTWFYNDAGEPLKCAVPPPAMYIGYVEDQLGSASVYARMWTNGLYGVAVDGNGGHQSFFVLRRKLGQYMVYEQDKGKFENADIKKKELEDKRRSMLTTTISDAKAKKSDPKQSVWWSVKGARIGY